MAEVKMNKTYKWTMMQPSGVSPLMKRRCHSAVIFGTSLYLFGGYEEETRCSADLFVLDMIKQEWRALSPSGTAPSARAYHAACFVGRDMFIVGGASYSRVRNVEVHALNIDTMTWREYKVQEGQSQPAVRCGHRVFALGKCFYMLGGSDDDTYFDDFWCFDTELGTWSELHPSGMLPPPRNSFALNLVGDDLYVFGGQIPGRQETNDFYKLNLPSMHWTRLYEYRRGGRRPRSEDGTEIRAQDDSDSDEESSNNSAADGSVSLNNSSAGTGSRSLNNSSSGQQAKKVVIPPPRADHGAVTVNKKIYVFGGFTGVYPNSTRYRDLYCYDTETEVWRLLSEQHGEIPFGMSGHTLSQYGNNLVLLGGFAGSYESINDNVYTLEVPQSDLTLLELCLLSIVSNKLYSPYVPTGLTPPPSPAAGVPAFRSFKSSFIEPAPAPASMAAVEEEEYYFDDDYYSSCSVRLPLELEERLVY